MEGVKLEGESLKVQRRKETEDERVTEQQGEEAKMGLGVRR